MGIRKGILAVGIVLAALGGLFFLTRSDERRPPRLDSGAQAAEPAEVEQPPAPPEEVRPAVAAVATGGATGRAELDVTLPELLIDVVHADAVAAAGARVALLRQEVVLGTATTDAEGRARFDPRPGQVEVWVLGVSSAAAQTTLADAHGSHRIVLPDGALVEGIVRVNGAIPAEPVELALRPAWKPELPDGVRLWGRKGPTVRTGPDGSFRFAGMEVGVEGRVVPPDWLEPADEDALAFTAPAGDLYLELLKGPLLSGRVVAAGGGDPVPFAHISYSLITPRMGTGSGTLADTEGRFRIPLESMEAAAGTAELQIQPPGGAGGRALLLAIPDFAEDHDAGDIVLSSTRDIPFIALDPHGRPISGAVATSASGARASAPTGSDGRSVLSGLLPEEASMTVVALLTAETKVELPASVEAPLEVVLAPCAHLEVRVHDPEGEPVEDMIVVLRSEGPLFDGPQAHAMHSARIRAGASPSRGWATSRGAEGILSVRTNYRTDDHGRVLVPGLRHGTVLHLAVSDAAGFLIGPVQRVVLDPEEDRLLELETLRRPRRLTGVLRGPDGGGVVAANVSIHASVGRAEDEKLRELSGTRPGNDGRFKLEPVIADLVDVRADAEGYATLLRQRLIVPEEGAVLELRMEPGASATVAVVDVNGRVIRSGRLQVELAGVRVGRASRQDEVWTLSGLPADELVAVFELAERTFRRSFVARGERVEIEIPATGSVETAWDLSAEPDVTFAVTLEPDFGEALRFWRTPDPENRRGVHTFDVVFPGSYTARVVPLNAEKEGLGDLVPARTVEVAAGATLRVALGP